MGGNPHITDLVFTITEADITTGCDQASIKAPAGFVKMIHASSRKAPPERCDLVGVEAVDVRVDHANDLDVTRHRGRRHLG